VVLVRHGETEWTIRGRHTGRTDVPLTDAGRVAARALGDRLVELGVTSALSSPRRRSMETAALAGFSNPTVLDELAEWDYGDYEGLTTAEIRATAPDWTLWTDGAPGGETAVDVGARADVVIDRLRGEDRQIAVFSHGHLLRVLATRWLEIEPQGGRWFALSPASISILGWEREQAVLRSWNVTS
jgi:broad specificity phosphatase PhoE